MIMEWTEIFQVLIESGILGWIVGATGVAFIVAMWRVFKEGRETKLKRDMLMAEHGPVDSWPEKAMRAYIKESFEFWDALSSFWKTIWRGIKKLFTK